MDDILKKITELEKEVNLLKQRRVSQTAIIPGVVKNRHLGEASSYVVFGLEADLPVGLDVNTSTIAYFATDTNKWHIWNPTTQVYVSVTLT